MNIGVCFSGSFSYTALYNTLNFPAGSVRVTTVDLQDEEEMVNYPELDFWYKAAKKVQHRILPFIINCGQVEILYRENMNEILLTSLTCGKRSSRHFILY